MHCLNSWQMAFFMTPSIVNDIAVILGVKAGCHQACNSVPRFSGQTLYMFHRGTRKPLVLQHKIGAVTECSSLPYFILQSRQLCSVKHSLMGLLPFSSYDTCCRISFTIISEALKGIILYMAFHRLTSFSYALLGQWTDILSGLLMNDAF